MKIIIIIIIIIIIMIIIIIVLSRNKRTHPNLALQVQEIENFCEDG